MSEVFLHLPPDNLKAQEDLALVTFWRRQFLSWRLQWGWAFPSCRHSSRSQLPCLYSRHPPPHPSWLPWPCYLVLERAHSWWSHNVGPLLPVSHLLLVTIISVRWLGVAACSLGCWARSLIVIIRVSPLQPSQLCSLHRQLPPSRLSCSCHSMAQGRGDQLHPSVFIFFQFFVPFWWIFSLLYNGKPHGMLVISSCWSQTSGFEPSTPQFLDV